MFAQNPLLILAVIPYACTSFTAGDSKGFTDTYLEAIRLQQQAQRSIGPGANQLFEQNVPYEIYLKIFGYLSARDVCRAMTVCKVRK